MICFKAKLKKSGQNTAGSCNKSNRRFKDSICRGSGRIKKTEPDVCRDAQSASGSYYKYQSDCTENCIQMEKFQDDRYVVLSSIKNILKYRKESERIWQLIRRVNKRTNTHGAMRNCIEYVLRQDKTSELLTYVTGPYCHDADQL